jgi:3-methyladenine DNA glycosylase AlkD
MTDLLFKNKDLSYAEFQRKLIPTLPPDTIIGVRTPQLKAIAKALSVSDLGALPHKYFEENQLHAFIIGRITDFDKAIIEVEKFLPFINNWATCDQLVVKAFSKNPENLLPHIKRWINSDKTYTVRFGIGLLMRYFLDEKFEVRFLHAVAAIKSDEYYINMMSAWYFATALAKQYDCAITLFENGELPVWVHNKAIQKARESFRVSAEHKEYLKTLKKAAE